MTDEEKKEEETQTPPEPKEPKVYEMTDAELADTVTAICEIVDAQSREGWSVLALVFGNPKGEFRCFQADHIQNISDLFRHLADARWFEAVKPIQSTRGN